MDVPQEIIERLRQYKAEHGRTWKAQLRHLWMVGGEEDQGLIRQARNIVGPSRLDKIKL